MAAGLNHYLECLEDFKSLENLEPVFHQKLLEEFKTYMAIGGMPEAVKTYLDKKEFSATREVQNQILRTYELDFSKYAGSTEAMRISQLWVSIPTQIAKENQRFFFSAIKNSARSREYENSTQWLIDAGLVIRSTCVKLPNLPLSAYIESNIFKLFLLDVGLLGAQCKISPSIFVGFQEYFTHFKGSLFENYIAQELTAQSLGPLYYWKSKANAELDFILQLDNHIIPVEVKSGANRKSKSLKFYREKYKPTLAIKITPNRYSKKDALVELPVYATELISRLDQTSF
ncbi:MAG: DUF4143 domain-containing protein [Deltaproteobacteria bacterium]|nr:DUF4143 domain-containing protein [Deltaproteobacteria bacterium]